MILASHSDSNCTISGFRIDAMTNSPYTIPNFLSGLRLAMVPVLLVLALGGRPTAYLILFIVALLAWWLY